MMVMCSCLDQKNKIEPDFDNFVGIKGEIENLGATIVNTDSQKYHEKQNNEEIEVTNKSLGISVKKWLSELFRYFTKIYWKKIQFIKVTEKHIPKYSPWIANDILLNSIEKDWKTIIIDISDSKIKTIYDNAVEKLASAQGALNSILFWTVSREIRNHKWDKIKNLKEKWGVSYYEERKRNITSIVKILYEVIVRDIQLQWWNIKIIRNWKCFDTISDALSSVEIFSQ